MNPAFKPGRGSMIAFALLIAALSPLTLWSADSLAAAEANLQAGNADAATQFLNQALRANPKDSQAYNLLCRVEYSTQHFDQAAEHCEKAVNLDPNNARYHDWLGRAIGERASRASAFSAFSLARKSREQFEIAVKLDPHDAEALSDLGEFYKEAPGVVGGGTDKANQVANQLESVDPARAHLLRSEIAEKDKDLDTAERELKAACTGPRAAILWMELAGFYRHHQRYAEMDDAIKSGVAAAASEKHSAIALFDAASNLARADRNAAQAIKFFEEYLASPNKTEDAPAFEALTRLARLRKQNGDLAGAQRDQASALALAHDYRPAQNALQDPKH